MADRSVPRLWKALAAGCCLVSSVAWLTGAAASSGATGSPDRLHGAVPASRTTGSTLRVLQFNLCDSGIAGCYTGRSVRAAAAVIGDQRPDVVTLNEVCRGDVSELRRAMSDADRGSNVVSAFRAAADRRTGGPFRCLNGQQYGIGVLSLISSTAARYRTYGGVYAVQDLTDPEERVWVCIHAPTEFYACTTHTASTSTAIALAQCRNFLQSAVPGMRSTGGDDPVVLGADLNLLARGAPGPQSCVPGAYHRADDGSRQDVVASPGIALRSRAVVDMHGTTDHPGLVVDLAGPRGAAR